MSRNDVGWVGRLADCSAMTGGLSAPRPRLTGKFAAGDSVHGLGWGLFLKVPGSVGSLIW